MPGDANTRLLDAQVRHAIYLNRLFIGAGQRAMNSLSPSEAAVIAEIGKAFDAIVRGGLRTSARKARRIDSLIEEATAIRAEGVSEMAAALRVEFRALVAAEAEFQKSAILSAVGLKELLVRDAPSSSYSRAKEVPFAGRTFEDWIRGYRVTDASRVVTEIRAAFTAGVDRDTVVRRIQEVILPLSNRQAQTIARTSAVHFATVARDSFFEENADIILAERWTSVLDGRTSLLCAGRDGALAPLPGGVISEDVPGKRLYPPDARPPAHPNCRSIMVALLSPEGIVGDRPFVTDTRTREERVIDFREESRSTGKSIHEVRQSWARDRVGTVPAATTYESWLRRQPRWFQDDVLGPSRASLFRDGGLSLDRFTDYRGGRYTVADLRRQDAEAFRRSRVR